jgi:hypothetical protein
MTDEGSAAAHTGTIGISIMDSDVVTVTATVDPFLTFDIDTATAHGDSVAPYTVALGTITTSDVEASGGTDGVNAVFIDLDTNATLGAVVTVQNANGANGLVSTSSGPDNILNTAATMSAGTENYGLCVATADIAGVTRAGSYNSGNCALNGNTNDVIGLTTTPASIVSVAGPVASASATVVVNAAIAATTDAHNDYTDTLTFIGTSTF